MKSRISYKGWEELDYYYFCNKSFSVKKKMKPIYVDLDHEIEQSDNIYTIKKRDVKVITEKEVFVLIENERFNLLNEGIKIIVP